MFQTGQQIGGYRLIEKIGKGGFGEVWLAERRSQFVTKKVAVKLPHDEDVDFDAIRQEATLWEEASGHPNVLPIIDADVYDGQVAIVSEYADGGSLADRLKIEGKLPIREAVEMTVGILNGLEFLHSKNIIHRDIKPANILLQEGTPRLADFGISRAVETATASSVIVGTENYMSPESFEGFRSVQTDVWSVGVLLYKLLSGNLPFPQKQPSEVMYAVLMKESEPLPADIPNELQKIVFKALEKDKNPGQNSPLRYQTAAAMREDLRVFLESFSADDGATARISPVSTASEMPEETRVKLRIPTGAKQDGWNSIFQSLFQRKFAPLTLVSILLGFAGIVLLAVYMTGQSSPSGSENSNAANSATRANISNSANRAASNSDESAQSAFDYFSEGNKHFQRKRYDRAIEAYTKAIEINPEDFSFYNNRGLAFYAKRRYPEAINDFTKAAEYNPESSFAYSNRGVAYEDSGNVEQAIADYRRAVELDPNDATARNNLNKLLK